MFLTDEEKRMLDGSQGLIPQRAMELLIRYGEALGAESLLKVDKVYTGTIGCSSTNLMMKILDTLGDFSHLYAREALCFDLNDGESFSRSNCYSCALCNSLDAENWEHLEVPISRKEFSEKSDEFSRAVGIHLLATCAPYEAGSYPMFGEHIASMESSAVSLFNSVFGARTNTEGTESAIASTFTGRTPKWGFHLDENRRGTHLIKVETPVRTTMDWGLLGYYFGGQVQDRIPVVDGIRERPLLHMLKHCGAAAASSGGVEMYHIAGITPEARDVADAFKGNPIQGTFVFGEAELRACYEKLNTGIGDDVNHIVLGCPHYSLEQICLLCREIEGKHVHENVAMWVFTPYAVRELAKRQGYEKMLADAGVLLLSDACPALSELRLKRTTCVATDSAKMAKYYHDMTGLPTYFGSMEDCVAAATTGKWHGELKKR